MCLISICQCEANLFTGTSTICICDFHVSSGIALKARPAPNECRDHTAVKNVAPRIYPAINPLKALPAPDRANL